MNISNFFKLNSVFIVYSISLLFSKIASGQERINDFIFYYCCSLLFMVIYAIGWQFVLKTNKLSIAYSYKVSTLLWGVLLGTLIFGEKITPNMIIGGIIILIGVWIIGDHNE